MDSVVYTLDGDKLNIKNGIMSFKGYTYEAVQESLDYCVAYNATPNNIAFWQAALAYLRSHLYVTPSGALVSEEQAHALDAMSVQCGWARMGCTGGAM